MKISICIPQYNRINLLLKGLRHIANQTYGNIEIVVSDDCSTDDTESEIKEFTKTYKYPIVFFRFEENQGYDRNYRKCIELGTGDYCLVIGNDDTLNENNAIELLVNFLTKNNLPDIGYCNFIEEKDSGNTVQRAMETKVHGSGIDVAIKHANGFSFVGGLIYKKESFDQYNTAKHDGSIYSQMYLGLKMIADGCILFTIKEPLVLKDIHFDDGSFRWSAYRDGLPKGWLEYKRFKSGLLSVMNVLISACKDAKTAKGNYTYTIMKRMYTVTYPYWVIEYKHYGSMAASWALSFEMNPKRNNFTKELSILEKIKIFTYYYIFTSMAFLTPYALFMKFKKGLHKMVRSN